MRFIAFFLSRPLFMYMNTTVKCDWCERMFEKSNSEINRCKKRTMANCCSRSCTAKLRNSRRTKEYYKNQYIKHPVLAGHAGNRLNELSPFKTFLNSGRASMVKHKNDLNIDAQYLKDVWERQNGICPYTGVKMMLPKSSSKYHTIHSLKKASLDRIDSSIGYRKGNVEFICLAINLAKNNHTKKDMIDFIKEIAAFERSINWCSRGESNPCDL